MRSVVILFAAVAASIAVDGYARDALAAAKLRLAQTSTVTNCMMVCNSQFANCQSACIVSGTLPTTTTSSTTNANPNSSATCISSCTNQEISCQTTCARTSPSP